MAFAVKILKNESETALETAINAYLGPLAPTTCEIEYSTVFVGYPSGTPSVFDYAIVFSALILTT